jgi:hypothetical protein
LGHLAERFFHRPEELFFHPRIECTDFAYRIDPGVKKDVLENTVSQSGNPLFRCEKGFCAYSWFESLKKRQEP